MQELTDSQRRYIVDTRQVYEAWRQRRGVLARRYAGSMRWLTRGGHDYLHRKIGRRERSLGRRSAETEAIYEAFLTGRAAAKAEQRQAAAQLDERAPVVRAMGLGRVPRLSARILRKLDEHELLGEHLLLIGTHALYAYEAVAGVHIRTDLLATGDVDLLWDSRQRLALVVPEARKRGVLGILRKVDRSFRMRRPMDFRASNADGFWVDLVRPEDADFLRSTTRDTLGATTDDLHGAAVTGLQWLLNAPRFEAVAMAEDGYPVRTVTVDPRVFALHKLWLAARADRDPLKAPRDRRQGQVAALLAMRWLGLGMTADALPRLPAVLRARVSELALELGGEAWGPGGEDGAAESGEPGW